VSAAESYTPELADLFEHEKVIEQGLAGFVEVGLALLAIRDGKKYRHAGFSTFEDYCQRRWSISRPQGYRLLSAAEAVSQMSPIGDIARPANEAQVRPLTKVADPVERAEVWQEAVESAGGGQPTAAQVQAVVERRQPPNKEHPATYSDAILDKLAEHVQGAEVVLDPFAGTGRIHELRDRGVQHTIGIELEAEWADKHPDTIHGSALEARHLVPADVDAIVTSPTYGNRMADHHDAKDDSVRLTYKHTLGRDLTEGNSGAMQWGDEYRIFHKLAWDEAVSVLKPGGTLTLNCKNHVRNDEVQRVVEWHVDYLIRELGLQLVAWDTVPTRGLMAGANADRRVDHEVVVTLRKVVS
jgi:DNA modification methylase